MKTNIGAYSILFLTSLLLAIAGPSSSFASDSVFESQCKKNLRIANSVADECLREARPFERYFSPSGGARVEIEHFSVFFHQNDEKSQFLLGCVLDRYHNIRYIGMYYSPTYDDIRNLADSEISFIDFNSNVGMVVDGMHHTFIPVGRFDIDEQSRRISPDNIVCNSDGSIRTKDALYINNRFKITDDDTIKEIAHDGSVISQTSAYIYRSKPKANLIYAQRIESVFVDANGALILSRQRFDKLCQNQTQNVASISNIYYEMCHK